MFKVKNSNVIARVSRRSLKNSRTRNIIAIAAIILTAVMFTTVFTIGSSIVETFQLSTMRQVGTSSHAGFKLITWQQYDKIAADSEVKDISYNVIIGFGENPELSKTYTEIRYTEAKAAEWDFSMPTTGTLPQERLDIATTTAVLDALGVPHELGATVPLEFTANGVKYQENFTLCGWWEIDAVGVNQAYLSREYCEEVAPIWQDGQEASFDLSAYSGSVNAELWFSTSWDIDGQVQALKDRCGFGAEVNDGVNWAYTSSSVDLTTILLIAGLLIIIVLSGYLIIYNIFYISVSNEIKFYGLLKTIGTTNKQLKRVVRLQAFFLSVIGIPLGLIIGYGVSILLMPTIINLIDVSDSFSVSVNPIIFVGSCVFTLITVWISCIKPSKFVSRISPVEAVRYTESAPKRAKKHKKTRTVNPITMALSNIGRTPKKTIAVVLSLALSLILLNGTVTMVDGFDMDKYVQNYIISDFYMTDSSTTNYTLTDCYNGISSETRTEVMALDGVTEAGSIYMLEYIHTLDEASLKKAENVLDEFSGLISSSDREFIQTYLDGEYMPSHLYGADEFVFDKLEIFEGQFDKEKFMTGDYVIASTFTSTGEGHFYDIGDKVTIDFGNGVQKEYEVMALGDVPYALGPRHTHAFDVYFTMYSEEFISQTGETGALNIAFNASPESYDSVLEWVKNYCENVNSSLDYTSKETYTDSFKTGQRTFLIIGGSLSFILALIGILNFINAIVTSIQSRRQELAVLQSIGMTGKQLRKMLIGEGICYIIMTAAFALTVGSLIAYGLVQAVASQMWYFTYHFVYAPIALSIPVLVILSAIIPAVCYKNMCGKSVVERLRETET